MDLTGAHPFLQVLTVASNTRKFDSGILKALKLVAIPSPARESPRAGNTKGSTGQPRLSIRDTAREVYGSCNNSGNKYNLRNQARFPHRRGKKYKN